MNQMLLFFFQVAPYGFIISFFLLIVLYLSLPNSAKVRLKAKWSKTGVLVTLCNDAGFEETLLMQADMGSGIFTNGKDTYIFTPNPPFIHEDGVKKLDLEENVKKNLDEALQNRMLTDSGKPHYIGFGGTGVATTPKMLQTIKRVNRKGKLSLKAKTGNPGNPGGNPGDNPGPKETTVKLLELIDPKLLKTYLEMSFAPELMKIIKFKHERIGEDKRPLTDLRKWAIPGTVVVIIIVILYYVSKGSIKIPAAITGALGQ